MYVYKVTDSEGSVTEVQAESHQTLNSGALQLFIGPEEIAFFAEFRQWIRLERQDDD